MAMARAIGHSLWISHTIFREFVCRHATPHPGNVPNCSVPRNAMFDRGIIEKNPRRVMCKG